ncbi:ABC-type sugar transport system substrate-binding protein [Lachnospiraceae bacterium PF1-22]|uniref:DUF3798 domain-containing protein n=1 Tax=Ohessyouella blattaphilus TaxID=2949333 RepID=UPI003E2890AD
MKKLIALFCVLTLTLGLWGCRSAAPAETEDDGEEQQVEVTDDYKIGIITGTVSQGEEEFQAAQQMIEEFGKDRIVTATYPDKFNDEVETTIAQVVNLASDEKVKAIVFVQSVPGAIAAIEKTRETRPDMLFVCGVAAEAPREIAAAADVVMLVDEIGMGTTVIEQAKEMGATTFVHYSFPRHLGYETIAARTALFKENCEKEGITYVEATAPDPTGDAGTSGAQQFILEDVPRKIEEYGKDTAFFSTNCSMQEPLIRTIAEMGAIFPQQCCPSPYHAYPAALNIETAGHEGDVEYMLDQITTKVEEAGNTGRMSTWPLPVNMLMVEAGVDYAQKFCEGKTDGSFDDAEMRASISKIAKKYNATETLSLYADDEGEIDNFYMILCDFYNF